MTPPHSHPGTAIVGMVLLFGLPAFTVAAIITGEWRYLIGAGACWLLLRGK